MDFGFARFRINAIRINEGPLYLVLLEIRKKLGRGCSRSFSRATRLVSKSVAEDASANPSTKVVPRCPPKISNKYSDIISEGEDGVRACLLPAHFDLLQSVFNFH